MIDRSEWILWLAGASVLLLLCLLAGLAWYKRRIDKLSAHVGGIPQGDVGKLHAIVADQQEATRQHVSNVMGSTQRNTDVIKSDLIDVKSLLAMLISRFTGGPRR
jgi:hypothetical protein